jgi:glycosyltransferase involved in cell wall biosynthesis
MAESYILIVIPTLGQRPELLAHALRSITDQAGPSADMVVVVPRDAFEAREVATAAGAQLVDDPGGQAAAINAGWALAGSQHRYISWLCDDDLLAPGALAETAGALDADPGAVVAFGYCDYVDGDGTRLGTSRAGKVAPWLMTWGPNLVPQPGALFRLAAVRKVGGVDDSLNFAMDLDLLLRLRREGSFVNTRRTLAAFRWHVTSITVSNRSPSLDECQLIKRRYQSAPIRRLAFLWEHPIRLSTQLAARHVNRRALQLSICADWVGGRD